MKIFLQDCEECRALFRVGASIHQRLLDESIKFRRQDPAPPSRSLVPLLTEHPHSMESSRMGNCGADSTWAPGRIPADVTGVSCS